MPESFPAWSAVLFSLDSGSGRNFTRWFIGRSGAATGMFLSPSGVDVTILSGDGSDVFSVDQNGTLLTKAPLDFEKEASNS